MYDHNRVLEYVERAKSMEPINFKTLYFWLTEAFEWAGHPRGVPSSMLVEFGQMGWWEKANAIDRLGQHLAGLCRADFHKLVGRAREWDQSQEQWRRRT